MAVLCLKINLELIQLVMIWPICGRSNFHRLHPTVRKHLQVYPQHQQLTQIQLLRQQLAHLSSLEFKNNNSNPPSDFDNFDKNVLSGINFQTPKREAMGSSFQFSNAHLFRDSKR